MPPVDREEVVIALVDAAGGELIGRVRLQKTAYILAELGFRGALDFEYHHYGPFSRYLEQAVEDAKAFGLLEEKQDRRPSDGATFSRFRLIRKKQVDPSIYGDLGIERTAQLVRLFSETNVTVLELSATIIWLARKENHSDWRSEIAKRKGRKLTGGRLEKAVALLETLGISPISSPQAAMAG